MSGSQQYDQSQTASSHQAYEESEFAQTKNEIKKKRIQRNFKECAKRVYASSKPMASVNKFQTLPISPKDRKSSQIFYAQSQANYLCSQEAEEAEEVEENTTL